MDHSISKSFRKALCSMHLQRFLDDQPSKVSLLASLEHLKINVDQNSQASTLILEKKLEHGASDPESSESCSSSCRDVLFSLLTNGRFCN